MRKKTGLSAEEQQQLLKDMFGRDAFPGTAKEVIATEQQIPLLAEKAMSEPHRGSLR